MTKTLTAVEPHRRTNPLSPANMPLGANAGSSHVLIFGHSYLTQNQQLPT